MLAEARPKLLKFAAGVWPGREKILTAWNGLMIAVCPGGQCSIDPTTPKVPAAELHSRECVSRRQSCYGLSAEEAEIERLSGRLLLPDRRPGSLYEATFAPRWLEAAPILAES